jgi:hypothetical protein
VVVAKNRTAQRKRSNKSEAEADIIEISSGVSCFNAGIGSKLSDLTSCNDDGDHDSHDRIVTAADKLCVTIRKRRQMNSLARRLKLPDGLRSALCPES